MKALRSIAGILVLVGALNWGLVALAEFDLVAAIFGMEFGETSGITRIIYGFVGLSALVVAGDRIAARSQSGARTVGSAA